MSASTTMPSYLNGVQGLRTVAALMVAVYHIWFGRVSGGVDVFFVIAGYFAAKSLMRMGDAGSMRERARVMSRYWMRTLRRITPSAAVVIVGTTVAAFVLLPMSTWQYTIPHGFAALFHYENWQLIASNADYLQDGMAASPFQQFWALSLQVQFYLIFPLLLLAAVSFAKRRGWGVKGTVVSVLTATLCVSFAFAIWYTAVNQPAAYFNTFARGWEFMAGAILFLVMTRGLAQKAVASVMGWVGLLVLLVLGALVDVSALFPGWVALIPVAAAILIMISAASRRAPIVLSRGPLVWFGNASFAFYLWHWPILVLYRHRFGEQPGLKAGLAILLLSAVLAYLTTRFIETPVRDWKRIQGSVVGTLIVTALLIAPAAGALGYWKTSLSQQQAEDARLIQTAISGGTLPEGVTVPSPAQAREDNVGAYEVDGCYQRIENPEFTSCVLGDKNAKHTIAVVGSSHAMQWVDVVVRAAERVDAKVEVAIKSRCHFADIANLNYKKDPSCEPWAEDALEYVLETKPDLVVALATRQKQRGPETAPEAYAAYFEKLAEAGIPIIGIRDNPRFGYDIPECVEREGAEACELPRSAYYPEPLPYDLSRFGDFTFVDVADDLCKGDTCQVVQEGVLVYRDKHHLTRTWTLRNGARLENAVVDWFARNP